MAEQPHQSGKPLMGLLYDTGTVAEPRISVAAPSSFANTTLRLLYFKRQLSCTIFHPFKPSPAGLNLRG